jgi:hypothetical protein
MVKKQPPVEAEEQPKKSKSNWKKIQKLEFDKYGFGAAL